MSGSTQIPTFELAQGYALTVPGPIDDRTIISEVANLDTELVGGVRYPGLLVWVENSDIDGDGNLDGAGEFYLFNSGIDNSDFITLRAYIDRQGISNTAISYVYTDSIPSDSITSLAHNLGSSSLQIELYSGDDMILVDWNIPAYDVENQTRHLNVVEIRNTAAVANLKVVVAFVGTVRVNPPDVPIDDVDALYKTKRTSVVADITEPIAANSKIESIDYQIVTGPVTIKCGTTIGGDDVHNERTYTSDAQTELLHVSFMSSTILYFTVTSGIVNININQRLNVF